MGFHANTCRTRREWAERLCTMEMCRGTDERTVVEGDKVDPLLMPACGISFLAT